MAATKTRNTIPMHKDNHPHATHRGIADQNQKTTNTTNINNSNI